jgi:Uma2 family endonuclease
VVRAELIEGIVFMAAAVRHSQHGQPQRLLIGWLDRYIGATPGTDGGLNATVVLDEDNVPQPDGYLFLPAEVGGQCSLAPDGYLEGPPALVAEISASTKSIDLHLKFQAYRRNGISEYIVWRVREKAIDWFVLQDGDYQLLPPDADGILKSRICPGLWLDPTALVKRRTRRVQEVLDLGMATPEYREFADRVARFAPPEEE